MEEIIDVLRDALYLLQDSVNVEEGDREYRDVLRRGWAVIDRAEGVNNHEIQL